MEGFLGPYIVALVLISGAWRQGDCVLEGPSRAQVRQRWGNQAGGSARRALWLRSYTDQGLQICCNRSGWQAGAPMLPCSPRAMGDARSQLKLKRLNWGLKTAARRSGGGLSRPICRGPGADQLCVAPGRLRFGGSFQGAGAATLGDPGGRQCSPRTMAEVFHRPGIADMLLPIRLASRRAHASLFSMGNG